MASTTVSADTVSMRISADTTVVCITDTVVRTIIPAGWTVIFVNNP